MEDTMRNKNNMLWSSYETINKISLEKIYFQGKISSFFILFLLFSKFSIAVHEKCCHQKKFTEANTGKWRYLECNMSKLLPNYICIQRHTGKPELWTHGLDVWTLGAWTLDPWTLGIWTPGLWKIGRLDASMLGLCTGVFQNFHHNCRTIKFYWTFPVVANFHRFIYRKNIILYW